MIPNFLSARRATPTANANCRRTPSVKPVCTTEFMAMQARDGYKIATSANWRGGEDVTILPPGSCGSAAQRLEKASTGYRRLDRFLCLKRCPGK